MGYRGEIPDRINFRVKRNNGAFELLEREGQGWIVLRAYETYDKALAEKELLIIGNRLKPTFDEKMREWSLGVKTKGRWSCEEPGCGEIDRELLESHHIEPVAIYPEKRHDLDNGKCLCMLHHALQHKGRAYYLIMERLALKLYGRLYPHKKAEIHQRMAG